MAAGQRRNRILVPGAEQAIDQFKYQVASEVGLPNYRGYLGDIPARQHGAVGGNMVRRMIFLAEQQLAGGAGTVGALGPTPGFAGPRTPGPAGPGGVTGGGFATPGFQQQGFQTQPWQQGIQR